MVEIVTDVPAQARLLEAAARLMRYRNVKREATSPSPRYN